MENEIEEICKCEHSRKDHFRGYYVQDVDYYDRYSSCNFCTCLRFNSLDNLEYVAYMHKLQEESRKKVKFSIISNLFRL